MAIVATGVPCEVGDVFHDDWAERDVFRFRLSDSNLPAGKDGGKPYMESITAGAALREQIAAAAKSNSVVHVVCRIRTVAPSGKSPFAVLSAVKVLAD